MILKGVCMKKILLILFILAFSYQTKAQEYGFEDISETMNHFGVKLGLNIASLNPNPDDDNYESAVKFPYIGLISTMDINKMFTLQTELGYNLLGAKYQLFSNGEPLTISLGYITIGAIMKAYFIDNLGLNVNLGLQYGYMIYATHDDLDRLDQYKTSDFDLLVGLGYDFDIGFFVEARYLLGFTNISNLQDIHYSNSIKNNAIQIQVGWLF